jgi:hypothetical protein
MFYRALPRERRGFFIEPWGRVIKGCRLVDELPATDRAMHIAIKKLKHSGIKVCRFSH